MAVFQILHDCIVNKYASGKGRASRDEFVVFFGCLVLFVLFWLLFIVGLIEYYHDINLFDFVLLYIPLLFLPPLVAVCVRRLHDLGKSGWLLLLGLIPFINLFIIGLLIMRGMPGANRYGPAPA